MFIFFNRLLSLPSWKGCSPARRYGAHFAPDLSTRHLVYLCGGIPAKGPSPCSCGVSNSRLPICFTICRIDLPQIIFPELIYRSHPLQLQVFPVEVLSASNSHLANAPRDASVPPIFPEPGRHYLATSS